MAKVLSEEEIANFEATFSLFDQNGDGRIRQQALTVNDKALKLAEYLGVHL